MEGNPLHEKYPMYYDENGFPYSRTQRRKQDRERSAAAMLEAAWLRRMLAEYLEMLPSTLAYNEPCSERTLNRCIIEDFLAYTEGKR